MKKLTFILIFISMFWNVKSQIVQDTFPWCPPGASWLYKSSSPSSSIYFQFIYVKDTLFSNLNVKKLNVEAIQIIGPSKTEFARTAEVVGSEFLYNSNDSVYWYDKINNNFKFIYSFKPQLNDVFIVGNSRAKCFSDSTYTKNDTIRVIKFYKDTFENLIFEAFDTDYNRKYKLGTIIKNIGSLSTPFPQINGTFCNYSRPEYGIAYERLICYNDSLRGTITFSAQGNEECHFAKTFVKTIVENDVNLKSKLYPNPANNSIKIENTNNIKYQTLVIYNYLGKQIIELNEYKESIDILGLEGGFYIVKLNYENGITETIKFLKNLL